MTVSVPPLTEGRTAASAAVGERDGEGRGEERDSAHGGILRDGAPRPIWVGSLN